MAKPLAVAPRASRQAVGLQCLGLASISAVLHHHRMGHRRTGRLGSDCVAATRAAAARLAALPKVVAGFGVAFIAFVAAVLGAFVTCPEPITRALGALVEVEVD